MRIIVEFEVENREEYDELYSEISNFDGYVCSYIKKKKRKKVNGNKK